MMNRIIITRLLTRHSAIKNQQIHSSIRLLNKDESSSSDSSDSDNEKDKVKPTRKFEGETNEKLMKQTNDLLNNLLIQMSQAKTNTGTKDRSIPKKKLLPKSVPVPTLEEKIMDAAKDVANTLGGDVKQTEADLLNKIFSAGTTTPTPASTPETTQTEPGKLSLSHLLTGMTIDRTPAKKLNSNEELIHPRTQRVKDMRRKFQNIKNSSIRMDHAFSRNKLEPCNLYGGSRLNIFEPVTDTPNDNSYLKTWRKLEQDDLKSMLIHPPENIYQEMIQWTEKGILWKFPIDNEIGMDEEQNVHFSEHVFMNRHLKSWCPKKGPIRHFMELVCVGLSKNPYMTVQEKKDHIKWYQDFFSSKQQLLKEINAIEDDIPPSNSTKQIES